MGKSRQKQKSSSPSPAMLGWPPIALLAIFLARFLVPTEAPEQGGTLWLVSLTFGLGTVFFAWQARIGTPFSYRPALPDYALALLMGGNLVSGIFILVTGCGQPRAALNVMWEWLAIGLFWLLARLVFRNSLTRCLFTETFCIVIFVLSLLGIWQHYVWYPQQAQKFERLLELNEQGASGIRLTNIEQQEFQNLIRDFGTDVLTLDAPGRMAFLGRVRDSVEPIGLFVLANTFALPVAVALLLVTVLSLYAIRSQKRLCAIALAIMWLALLLCLILTKSRTAWIAAGVGFGFLSIHIIQSKQSLSRYLVSSLLVPFTIIIVLALWAAISGGLDKEVISEAPKSLQYRLEYWSATIELLSESPLLGAGPGNFRQRYLQFKLAGSSEEILDPHNLFLGAWANGGLLSLIGLLLLLACLPKIAKGASSAPSNSSENSVLSIKTRLLTILLTFALPVMTNYLLEGSVDQRHLWLGGMALGMVIITHNFQLQTITSSFVFLICLLVALIHLCGASGITMPAIVMLICLLLHFASLTTDNKETTATIRAGTQIDPRINTLICLLCVTGLFSSLQFGLLPVQVATTDLNLGRSLLLVEGKPHLAERYFLIAMEADPLAPEPQHQLAMLSMYKWKASGGQASDEFEKGITALHQAIELDPYSAGRFRTLGNFWDEKAIQEKSTEAAQSAVKAYEQAVSLYPNFAELHSELAMAKLRAGQPAEVAASRALELDQLNQENGHFDKVLKPEVLEELQQIVAAK